MARGRGRGGTPGRAQAVRVKTAKGRRPSSTRWLHRQLNDPYVAAARRAGYRSRAAWKLLDLDSRFGLLTPGRVVVDLGAAPGGWSQVAAERVRRGAGGRVIAVDLEDLEPIDGVEAIKGDVRSEEESSVLAERLGRSADVVLSDMAPSTTGHRRTDRLRSLVLCEAAHGFARRVLRPGGSFVAKMLEGGMGAELMATLKADFAQVRQTKPPASRSESPETYIVATGFRGGD